MRPLTDEQRALVDENQGLAYLTAYRMVNEGCVPKSMTEDAVQEAMIGLMQAARAFDPGRGFAFSTLAACCCRNRIRNAIAKEIRQSRVYGMSLDATAGEGSAHMANLLPAPNDTEQEAVMWTNDAVFQILADDNKPHYAAMLMDYAFGRPMEDIAKERGVSRQMVCKQIGRARQVLKQAAAQGEL